MYDFVHNGAGLSSHGPNKPRQWKILRARLPGVIHKFEVDPTALSFFVQKTNSKSNPYTGKSRTGQDKTNTRNARDSRFFEISPSAPLRLNWAGGRGRRALFELRSSLRFVQAVRAFAQPPSDRLRRRNPEGAARRGGLLLGYLFLVTQENVTSRRATPGEPYSSDARRLDATISFRIC